MWRSFMPAKQSIMNRKHPDAKKAAMIFCFVRSAFIESQQADWFGIHSLLMPLLRKTSLEPIHYSAKYFWILSRMDEVWMKGDWTQIAWCCDTWVFAMNFKEKSPARGSLVLLAAGFIATFSSVGKILGILLSQKQEFPISIRMNSDFWGIQLSEVVQTSNTPFTGIGWQLKGV